MGHAEERQVLATCYNMLGLAPFGVQLSGAQHLIEGRVVEMKTGEGKTLVSALAACSCAGDHQGVHIVTVNDYLAARDFAWMRPLYETLGLTVGLVVHGTPDPERKNSYALDVTYTTNAELGFDYLRDNMKHRSDDMVLRDLNWAIVDEVDNILIDEARTPLIISGQVNDCGDLCVRVNDLIQSLDPEDYSRDEKQKSVTLTEVGSKHIEHLLEAAQLLRGDNLYAIQNMSVVHHVNQALKAHYLFKRDVDYIVKDGKVILIDEFTGRMMEGRRYSDGLHQAIEAKECVEIEKENQTLASITFQNFFRMYKKLSGMTGTAATEAQELYEIYNLETVVIPTNVPVARKDLDDEVYRTEWEKYIAIIRLIKECHARQQPVLVGTISIEKSECLSLLLTQEKIPHNVLNARYHDVEAQIIADAGRPGAVTIATNMAGRGTDIKLGGNLEVRLEKALFGIEDPQIRKEIQEQIEKEVAADAEIVKRAGGLYVIGTERHESRRIDNQLRGRSGRQGDPGSSKFFLSLEDDLMRIFGAEKLDSMLQKLGIEEGEAIVHPWVNKALEKAQMRVEARNYDIRKHLLKYDDVLNDQRKIIYEQRRQLMSEDVDLRDDLLDMLNEVVNNIICSNVSEHASHIPQECMITINEQLYECFGDGISLDMQTDLSKEDAINIISENARLKMDAKDKLYSPAMMRYMERTVLLRLIDQYWKEHLLNLDRLRQGINLRAYAQRDPLNEYKQEAFVLFEMMSEKIRKEAIKTLSWFEFSSIEKNNALSNMLFDGIDAEDYQLDQSNVLDSLTAMSMQPLDVIKHGDTAIPFGISRNALCHCGSGAKYKHCCGKIT